MVILENQSTTTNKHALPCLVEGKPDMQSMDTNSQGLFKVDREVYNPYFLIVGFAMAQAMHNHIYLLMSCRSFGN